MAINETVSRNVWGLNNYPLFRLSFVCILWTKDKSQIWLKNSVCPMARKIQYPNWKCAPHKWSKIYIISVSDFFTSEPPREHPSFISVVTWEWREKWRMTNVVDDTHLPALPRSMIPYRDFIHLDETCTEWLKINEN